MYKSEFGKRKREKQVRLTGPSAKAVREHVRDTFARVLNRSPECQTTVSGEDNGYAAGRMSITVRDNVYQMQVTLFRDQLNIEVYKQDGDNLDVTQSFFRYRCPVTQIGKLRKTALILARKMSHREVHDVMKS